MELIYHLAGSIIEVDFQCRICSNMVKVPRGAWNVSSSACECGMKYWIDWQKSILHMNVPGDELLTNAPAEPVGGGEAQFGGGLSFEAQYRQWQQGRSE